MGDLTAEYPKCMTEIPTGDTLLSRQLKLLTNVGIEEIVMTTGYSESALVNYCQCLELSAHITYVKNPDFMNTNYIYSIYCAKDYLNDDIILLHGDLVFEGMVLDRLLESETSCMVVSSTMELPKKDFKAVVYNGKIRQVGVDCFHNAVAAQPLYKLRKDDWKVWLDRITSLCENGEVTHYAEDALNQVSDNFQLYPMDIKDQLCREVDTPEDLAVVRSRLREIQGRTVYMCFSTDILHSGHIAIIVCILGLKPSPSRRNL